MLQFVQRLSQSSFSLAIQTHTWVIPTVQSIHIVAIGVVISSVFMVAMRALGFAGADQTLLGTIDRFARPLNIALYVTLATGFLMVMGEPPRELLAFSFWMKMTLLAVATVSVVMFRSAVKKNEGRWQELFAKRWTARTLTIVMLFVWAAIIILGRLIAYDSIWGSWSKVPKD